MNLCLHLDSFQPRHKIELYSDYLMALSYVYYQHLLIHFSSQHYILIFGLTATFFDKFSIISQNQLSVSIHSNSLWLYFLNFYSLLTIESRLQVYQIHQSSLFLEVNQFNLLFILMQRFSFLIVAEILNKNYSFHY